MPDNDTGKKKVKDFTDEEKIAISARADKIELSRVAKEFNTTWQVVGAIQKAVHKEAAEKKQAKKQSKKAVKEPVSKKKAPKTEAASSKSRAPKITPEEKAAILARATEIGATEAALEAGISKWTIFQWRKTMKKAGQSIAPLARKKTSSNRAKTPAKKATHAPEEALKMPEAPKTKVKASATAKTEFNSSLEFENALLKEQIAALTKQNEKLRAALNQLA